MMKLAITLFLLAALCFVLAVREAATSGGTPAGTVTAPTFTGGATSVVQPYIVVYMFKRTA